MANEAKIGPCIQTRVLAAEQGATRISLALRSWIDNVIVPALVLEFLSQKNEKSSGKRFRLTADKK